MEGTYMIDISNDLQITNTELLQYICNNSIINLADVREQIEMKKRQEYLAIHPYEIWQGKNDKWYTYLPDDKKGRVLKKRNSERDIEDVIIEYWKSECESTFKIRFDVWVERQKNCGRSDNTIYKYQTDYKRFLEGDPFENLDIRKITEEDISVYFTRLLKNKKVPYKALKALFGYIKGVFEKSIRDKLIEINPCIYVDLPLFKKHCTEPIKKTSKERTLSLNEKKTLLKKITKSGNSVKYAVEFSLYTGMRVGELSALKWEDVNFEKNMLTICRSEKYSRITKEYYISDTKNDKVRIIPLTVDMKDVLLRAKAEEVRNGYLSEFVFCDENGRIHSGRISDWVRNNTMTNDFYNIKCVHAIRRTLNSNMKRMGVSTPVAAAILGHTEKVNEENYTYDTSSMEEKEKFVELAGKIG